MMENRNVQGVSEIEYLFEKLKLAWDRGDGEAYGACFTEDADYVTFQGSICKGEKRLPIRISSFGTAC